jgi:hypothetical protein
MLNNSYLFKTTQLINLKIIARKQEMTLRISILRKLKAPDYKRLNTLSRFMFVKMKDLGLLR